MLGKDDAMTWNVHKTLRDPSGDVRKEFVGSYEQRELPDVLEETFRQADAEHGGVQVTRRIERNEVLANST
jgi:hypothetical protein